MQGRFDLIIERRWRAPAGKCQSCAPVVINWPGASSPRQAARTRAFIDFLVEHLEQPA